VLARHNLLFISSVLAIAACSQRVSSGTTPSVPPSPFLFVWTNDADSVDLNYLAVVDAREDAATYGDVFTTLAVPTSGRIRGHHTEHVMPSSGTLFANDFATGKTYLIDLRDPSHPTLADSFAAAGDLTFPHSFERMPNGNVLATFQTTGQGNTAPGGIAELDARDTACAAAALRRAISLFARTASQSSRRSTASSPEASTCVWPATAEWCKSGACLT